MPIASPIAVAIVHDDPLAHACISAALIVHDDIVVCATTPDVEMLADGTPPLRPAVIVTDFNNGMRIASSRSLASDPLLAPQAIVIVSDVDREWELRRALACRVLGFLAPGFSLDQLAESVRAANRGMRYLCVRAATRLADSFACEALTDREIEVLTLVIEGLCNKSIGRTLNISNGTVKSHLKSTYAKLNVVSRTQAIAAAERRGLLERRMSAEANAEAPSHRMPSMPTLNMHRHIVAPHREAAWAIAH